MIFWNCQQICTCLFNVHDHLLFSTLVQWSTPSWIFFWFWGVLGGNFWVFKHLNIISLQHFLYQFGSWIVEGVILWFCNFLYVFAYFILFQKFCFHYYIINAYFLFFTLGFICPGHSCLSSWHAVSPFFRPSLASLLAWWECNLQNCHQMVLKKVYLYSKYFFTNSLISLWYF